MPHSSVDTHGVLVTDLLEPWTPRRLDTLLVLRPRYEMEFTRRAFADVLRSVGAIAEAWLQNVEEPHPTSESGTETCMKYKLHIQVELLDWKAEEEWWEGHLKSCFPTWEGLKRLSWSFKTRECTLNRGY